MTKEEMFKLGFRIAEAIYLKPGQVVKSEAEILAEMPNVVEDFPFRWKQVVNLDQINSAEITPELLKLMESRINAAHETMRLEASKLIYGNND